MNIVLTKGIELYGENGGKRKFVEERRERDLQKRGQSGNGSGSTSELNAQIPS